MPATGTAPTCLKAGECACSGDCSGRWGQNVHGDFGLHVGTSSSLGQAPQHHTYKPGLEVPSQTPSKQHSVNVLDSILGGSQMMGRDRVFS